MSDPILPLAEALARQLERLSDDHAESEDIYYQITELREQIATTRPETVAGAICQIRVAGEVAEMLGGDWAGQTVRAALENARTILV